MATQRYISTSFWTDKWIRELDPSERYLYMYLLTNPETTIAGVYKITIDRIAFDTGYDVRTLRPILDRFAAAGKAHFYADEWIIIPSWPRHQRIKEKDNNRRGIDKILLELPDDVWQFIIEKGYDYKYLKEVQRPFKAPSKPLTRSSNYSNSNSNSNLNSNSNSNADNPPLVDNSGTPSLSVYTEDVCSAAADVLNLRLKSDEAARIAESLTAHELTAEYIRWAGDEIRGNSRIKNSAGFLRKMLGDLDSYAGYITRYRSRARASPRKEPERAKPPYDDCPTCGHRLHVSGTELWCPQCKRLLRLYDEDFNIWIDPPQEADAAGW